MKFAFLGLSKLILGFIFGFSVMTVKAENVLSLEQAIALAKQNDPWLHGNQLKQSAIESLSVASATLPDPKVSITMMNLPTDTWDFEQEAMTQFKVGLSQLFPRGESLKIKANQLKIESTKFPLLRENRKAQLTSMISQIWLDMYLAQHTIDLIEKDSSLFAQMAEIAKASYSNTIGKTRQQDVIRAQLEIIQLEDRLTVEKQKLETASARLNEWLHIYDSNNLKQALNFDAQPIAFLVSADLPVLKLANSDILKPSTYSRNRLAMSLLNHPALLAIDVKQKVSEKAVKLAKQQYKPQWGVNASYGYRGDMPIGDSRADLLSVGVTFDLPIFTESKQDKQVAAYVAESEAVKTEKLLLIKQMVSAVEKEFRQLKRLSDRQSLYQAQLLKKVNEQAEASLTAYTNDDGDFAEVVRARIAGLNTTIAALKIDVDLLKTVARINYYFAKANTNNDSFLSQPDTDLHFGEK